MTIKLAGTKFELTDDFARVNSNEIQLGATIPRWALGASGRAVGLMGTDGTDRAEQVDVREYRISHVSSGYWQEAIATAANENPGRVIALPPGGLGVYGPINVRAGGRIQGRGSNVSSILQYLDGADTFHFAPTTAGVTSAYLNNPSIRGVNITHAPIATTATSGAGVRFLQCNGYKLEDVTVNDTAEGIVVQGGQLGSLKNFQIFVSSGLDLPDSGLLNFRQAPVGAGWQPVYTVEVEDFRISASKLRSVCIYIRNGDGIQIGKGYAAFGKYANLRLKAERDNSYISAASLSQVYLDCVGPGHTPYGIDIPADGFANSHIYQFEVGAGCVIGNGDEIGILCRKPELGLFKVRANILNMGKWAIDFEGGTGSDLHVVGSTFSNNGDSGSGVIRAVGGRLLNVTGNTFVGSENQILALAGTWRSGTITGNSNSTPGITELSNGATFTDTLHVAGNVGANPTLTTSWDGLRPGNRAVAALGALDWYLEGTFTPALTFGGAAVGMTYTTQSGRFTRIGNRVFFTLTITLSAKGSSTGVVAIGGLPYTAVTTQNTPCSLRVQSVANNVGEGFLHALVAANGTSVLLYRMDVSGADEVQAQLTDADLRDYSVITVAGQYEVA